MGGNSSTPLPPPSEIVAPAAKESATVFLLFADQPISEVTVGPLTVFKPPMATPALIILNEVDGAFTVTAPMATVR